MVKPLHDYLLIQPQEAKTQTESGLVLPTEEGKKTETAVILEVSEDVSAVKKGDKILFKSYSTDEVVLNNERFTFLKFDDVIAIL